ncbi:sensor histidine kinase [Herbidospora mongoliensis]|uniref:sensor histidine kinase n=1 Tax=Herbidospora mongoliensis TaxID=688067 RepID=UPI00082CF012|nr:sensor histidine kinase [Herbidospora mongoliensis]
MLGKLRAFRRRHPAWIDTLAVSPLVLYSLLSASYIAEGLAVTGGPAIGAMGVFWLSALLVVPLFWRRRFPLQVMAVVSGVSFFQWLGGVAPIPANMSVLVAMFAVVASCRLAWAVAAGVIAEVGIAMSLRDLGDFHVESFLAGSVFVLAVWIGGIYVNMRRRFVASLVERAERAERERDQQALIATAAERARIARELHDVVAHNVSVIIVQADGAGFAIDTDPDQAKRAVEAISATGRQALAEMRRLVGVLRDEGAESEEYAPQPGLQQLDDLVRQVRASGLPVDARVDGTPDHLAEGLQLVIYRIVQEALTNTLKHGGPGVTASVQVVYGTHDVLLRITDDGRGAASATGEGGHGLIGMRERVSMYGGDVHAAPKSGGGFLVVARIPAGIAR